MVVALCNPAGMPASCNVIRCRQDRTASIPATVPRCSIAVADPAAANNQQPKLKTEGEVLMSVKVKRKALNRGTAVHLGGARVRYIWACGCTKTEVMRNPLKRKESENTVAIAVRNWRANGVILEQCKKHPDYDEKRSPLARLNAANPQLTLEELHGELGKQKYQWRYIQQLTQTDVLNIVRNAEADIPNDQREVFMANVLRVTAHLLRQVERNTSVCIPAKLDGAGVMFENQLERTCSDIYACIYYLDARITGAPTPCADPNKAPQTAPEADRFQT